MTETRSLIHFLRQKVGAAAPGPWRWSEGNSVKGWVHASGAVVTDWRYLVTYEGVVSADDYDKAVTAALEDVDNGKIPNVEVEEIGE